MLLKRTQAFIQYLKKCASVTRFNQANKQATIDEYMNGARVTSIIMEAKNDPWNDGRPSRTAEHDKYRWFIVYFLK
jgi:hypothetical protein